MADKKLCPLLLASDHGKDRPWGKESPTLHCRQEKCAWWDTWVACDTGEQCGRCVILSLRDIGGVIGSVGLR